SQQAGIEDRVKIFIAGEKEQLVAVLVEIGKGNQHRPANAAAGVVILVRRLRCSSRVCVRVVRIQDVIPRVEERIAVKIRSAGLRYRGDNGRSLLVFSAIVRRKYLELLEEI